MKYYVPLVFYSVLLLGCTPKYRMTAMTGEIIDVSSLVRNEGYIPVFCNGNIVKLIGNHQEFPENLISEIRTSSFPTDLDRKKLSFTYKYSYIIIRELVNVYEIKKEEYVIGYIRITNGNLTGDINTEDWVICQE